MWDSRFLVPDDGAVWLAQWVGSACIGALRQQAHFMVWPDFTQCRRARAVFKKWGGVRKDLTKRMLHGRTYDEMPPLRGVEPCGRSQGFTR